MIYDVFFGLHYGVTKIHSTDDIEEANQVLENKIISKLQANSPYKDKDDLYSVYDWYIFSNLTKQKIQ